ncbi:MAG: beta-N-acetylhexosaminidase [Sediminimonas qiaohouensis]|uniref:beta-N-acetylhexosaminidase n=1 Tax=Sediminimonas qiaohouensis TaxID=552061 RepID=A0A7C9HC01_9RHOB|nr:beta-N-acetylhexosaminidase [Sediminimonas qiaohouensis]MTJ05731.1 beta-N-acetylhexosaminidase [Sediminimonas qiaohouensis]
MSAPGAVILDPLGPRLSAEERAFFRAVDPFGFILFARNIEDAAQLRALCAELRDCVGRDAPITIDQEGGRVQRLHPPLAHEWPPALDQIERAGQDAGVAMYLRARIIAHDLRALGIDSNCAPLADVIGPHTHPFLRNRCYGDAPGQVALLARAVADGLMAGGVLPVLKHIPGHGRAVVDSHETLPMVEAEAETLQQVDFPPFRALSDLPMAMTAHVVYRALDDLPATLSPVVMAIIRDDIGFDGLIMSDDISMKALSGAPADLGRATLAAGCDVVLHCNGALDEKRAVAAAAGRLSGAALRRAEAVTAARRTPDDVDISALTAQLETLGNGRRHG